MPPFTLPERAQVMAIREALDDASDKAYANLRTFRNTVLGVGLFMTAFLVAIAIGHAVQSSFIGIREATSAGSPGCATHTCAPTASVFQLEVLGLLGALVAAAVALAHTTSFAGPYDPRLAQVLIRIPTGAATALLAAIVIQGGFFSALKPQDSSALFAYAAVFGYAPNLFLGALDRRAAAAVEPARTRNDPGPSA